MAITQDQQDFAFYYQLLKGNYKKGVNALKGLLAVKQSAESFINNIGGLSVIYTGEDSDTNNLILYDILDNSVYGSQAMNNWFIFIGLSVKSTLEETLSDDDAMREVANNIYAVKALLYSKKYMEIVSQLQSAMTALVNSSIENILDIVHASNVAFNAVFESPYNNFRIAYMSPKYLTQIYGVISKTLPPYNISPKNSEYTFTKLVKSLPYEIPSGSVMFCANNRIYSVGCDTAKKAYMFGNVSTPDTFENLSTFTDAFSGCVAVIDNYIYYYGFVNSGSSYTKIFRASVQTPITITELAKTAPISLANSTAAVIGDYIYIYCGTRIMRASVSTPDTIISLTDTLPYAFDTGTCAVIGDYIYLIGGTVKEIMRASLSTPDKFQRAGNLPSDITSPLTHAIIGDYIYLYANTKIYRAKLSTPTDFTEVSGVTLPYSVSGGKAVVLENYVYVYGSDSSTRKNILSAPLTDLT